MAALVLFGTGSIGRNGPHGIITGTPAAVTASTSYVVTASNTGGSSQASLTITVAIGPRLA